jgi:microtubule-associated protein-like 6
MGATFSNDNRSDIKSEQLRLKELNPSSIQKLKQTFSKNNTIKIDKKQAMSILNIDQRECDILFDYFDMDGDGQIDNYELTCAIAMLVHSSLDLRAELLFKLYDFDSNNFLSKDELIHLIRSMTLSKKRPVISADVESRANDMLLAADLDLDKKLSLKEFQSYCAKNREIFSILDAYAPLLKSNPIGASTMANKSNKQSQIRNDGDEEDDNNNNYGDEDDQVNYQPEEFVEGEEEMADEMDPDLMEELNKDKEAQNRDEKTETIKKGVEYVGGFVEQGEDEADQFGALKPWITNVVNTKPSNYVPSKLDGTAPDAYLDLEFVHGYRCHDTRNNLRYTNTGEFVYHTAAVGIVYNKEEHKQRIFNEHFDDITALAIHPNRKIVATGEIGPYPLVSIWDIESGETLVNFREPLQKGINHLVFSRDGKYLIATAADDNHNIAVFDWQKGQAEDVSTVENPHLRRKKGQTQFKGPLYAYAEGGRANILGVCFSKSCETFACCCVKEVNVFKLQPGKLKKQKCTGLRGENLTSIMCCAYLNNTLICGSIKGKLLICAGTSFTKTLKAHSSSLNSIFVKENDIGFFTGGSDGNILEWDTKYQINSLNPKVRSLDVDSNGNMLIGTRGGEIIEIENGNPKVYIRGHWDKELWGLCVHPSKDIFYTCGEDKLLGVWNVPSQKLIQYTVLPEAAKHLAISPDGKDLAIGCHNGNLYIYDANTLKNKYKKKEKTQISIEEMKYSPDGKYLATGGEDKDSDTFHHVFIYDVEQKYKRLKKMKGHTSRVTHIDWSESGDITQSNSTSYELLYHDVSTGRQIKNISSLADTEWNTWTCVLGWPVQGIWPECASGDDINACDIDATKKVMVTADDYSKVKLFRYPSPIERSAYNEYKGHSSHVTNCRFCKNNKHVITVGGNDKAIFQFKFRFDNEAEEEAEEMQNLAEEEDLDEENDEDVPDGVLNFKEIENFDADEFGASKPWIGEMKASSPKIKLNKNMAKPPKENIARLNYVFGYRSFDTRNNLFYTKDENKIVYHTAALGVVIDKKTNKQKYFIHHKEDIVSLAIHPNKVTIATGQRAAKGEAKYIDLYIWNVNDLPDETDCNSEDRGSIPEGVYDLKGVLLRAISILAWSPDGKKLLAGGQDDQNSIAVFDSSNLSKITLISTIKVDGKPVLDSKWFNNNEFISVGKTHIKFYKVNGRNVTASKGIFGKVEKQILCSVVSAFKKVFTGSTKGNLITWEGSNASKSINICKGGAVYVLNYFDKEKLLFAGCFDGNIIAYDSAKLTEKYRLDILKITNTPTDIAIRAFDVNFKGEMIVGTRGGEIVEINLQNKTMLHSIMKSHYEYELWALTINPTNSYECATGGGDKTLRIWDLKKYQQKGFLMLPEDFRAIDWSSDGKFIIIGTLTGLIYYVDAKTLKRSSPFKSIFFGESSSKKKTKKQVEKEKTNPAKWIQELKISPNDEFCAFGSHCGIGKTFSKIQVLKITRNIDNPFKNYVTVDPKITSATTHLDWANDNDRIVINSLAFELKYISIGAKSVIKASSNVYDEDMWHTWTCLFGFPVQGIWPPATTGYYVNYTCMSNNHKVIATGDDDSKVKLFRSPSVIEHSEFKSYAGHSSHVPKVRFTPNDQFLISVGGNDKSVFIWETDFGQDNDDNNNEEDNIDGYKESVEEEQEQDDEQVEEEQEEEPEPEPPKKKKKTQPKPAQKKMKKPPEPEPEEEEEIVDEEQEEQDDDNQQQEEEDEEENINTSSKKKKRRNRSGN